MFYCQVNECGEQDIFHSTASISDTLSSLCLSIITLQDNSLDFEELRCHFTKKQWEELKEIEKIRFKNLKSNHLFKLSIGNVLYVTW